jgi:four helix bundle protein
VSWYSSCEAFDVYRLAFDSSMKVLEAIKEIEEKGCYTFARGITTSSRTVCYFIAEAIRKHHLHGLYIDRLNDAKEEAEETLVWLRVAVSQEYFDIRQSARLYMSYKSIIGEILKLITRPTPQVLKDAA